ncbi:zinc-ribbon domain containing protein [Desulfolucanica intricata]|uniref:zinc-ribbon domain containing protein n=1 Tax=Desulfolucanica intricata TaxID=1285191 RepID=UPI0009EDAFD2|nr:zinc-ribbon domain containing protein [Desulfolucanica intricata]
MYTDKTLVCRDCGEEFTFTAGEQEFYAEKGFANEPSRCPSCRAARKNQRNNQRNSGGRFGGERRMYEAVCAECGQATQLPFQPDGSRPVYCSDCFRQKRRYAY